MIAANPLAESFVFRSRSGMGAINLRSLEDMARWQADLRVRCNSCGREARFDAANMVRWFRTMRWNTSLDDAPRRFRCDGAEGQGCGSKDVRLSAIMPEGKMPPERPRPKQGPTAPSGINQVEWDKADERERKRLIDRLR